MPQVDEALFKSWCQAAGGVLEAMVIGGGDWSSGYMLHMPVVRARVRRLAGIMHGQGSTDWTPAVHQAWRAANRLTTVDAAQLDGTDATVAAAVRLGHAIATDRPDLVPVAERRELAVNLNLRWGERFAETLAEAAPEATQFAPPVEVGADGTVAVRFVHAWSAPVGRRGTREVLARNVAVTTLRTVGPDAARPVLRLRTADGTWLTVREHEGHLIRPVLTPGSAEPATLAAFVHAASSGPPWADDPFAAPSREVPVLLDMADRTVEVEVTDARAEAALHRAEVAALSNAGDLTVVDGIVHRRTGAPVLYLSGRFEPRPNRERAVAVHLSWRLGDDLDMWDTPSATFRSDVRVNRNLAAMRLSPKRDFGPGIGSLAFPVGNMGSAVGVAAAFDGRELLVEDFLTPGTVGIRTRLTTSTEPTVEVLAPDLFPRDPDAALDAIAAWADAGAGPWDTEEGVALREVLHAVREGTRDVADLVAPAEAMLGHGRFQNSMIGADLVVAMVAQAVIDAEPVPGDDPEVTGLSL